MPYDLFDKLAFEADEMACEAIAAIQYITERSTAEIDALRRKMHNRIALAAARKTTSGSPKAA